MADFMLAPAVFGIENDGINLAINLLILFLVVVYLALIAYTYLDAKRRIKDGFMVGCATVASLFPFVGTIVYTILRPPEFLADARERELEIRASELRVRQLEEVSCPNCEHPVERTFLRCPNCRARIKDPCESCSKPIDPRWSVCPYCETPTRRAAEAVTASTRRRASSAPPKQGASAAKGRPTTSRPTRATRPVSRTTGERPATKPRPGSSERPVARTQKSSRRRRPEKGDEGPRTAPAS